MSVRVLAPRVPAEGHLKVLVWMLVGFGLVMVYSASSHLSQARYGTSTVYFTSQFVKAVVGLVLMTVVARLDYHWWRRMSKPLLWVSVGLLAMLAVPLWPSLTPEINGARRWIALPGLSFQPLVVARLGLVVWMAATIARRAGRIDEPIGDLVPLLVVPAVMAGLLLLQPDFKGAALLCVVAGVMLFLGGCRWRVLAALGGVAVPVAGVLLALEPYRLQRIVSFVHPQRDLQGIGYQIHQSLISLGSGGWLGVGLGSSRQKLGFLPAAHNDFVFSIIGEELGLVGTLAILLAFLWFALLGFRIARRAPDAFGFLLASGVTALIVIGAFVNMGVATATLPTTGLTLPFISYGGTALIVQLVGVGILLSVSRSGSEASGRPKER